MYNRYIPQNDGSFQCVEVSADTGGNMEKKKLCDGAWKRILPNGLEKDDILILLILLLILQDEQTDNVTALAMIAAFILL